MSLAVLKGYRTVLFNLAMGGVSLLGLHLAPELVGRWLDVIIPATVIGNILLRAFTDTPMFNRLAGELHLSPAQMSDIREAVANAPSGADLPAAVADLTDKVTALAGHPLFDPALTALLSDALAKHLGAPSAAAALAQPSTGVKS